MSCCGYPVPAVLQTAGGMLSFRGRCFTYDKSADGYLRGEAVNLSCCRFFWIKKRTVVVCTQVYTLACWIQHWTYTATHIDMYTIKVLLPSERVEPSQPMGWELMSAGCFWHLLGAPALQQSGVAPVAGGWIGIFFLQFEQRPWHLHDSEEQNEGGLVISSNHACCLVAQRTTVWLSKGKKLWSHTRSGSGLIVTDSTSCSPIQNNLGLRPRRCLLACQQVRWDSPAEWRDFFCDWPNARHGIC